MGKKTGANPTDRGKLGVKRSILVEANGIPIGIAVAPANVHDNQLIEETFSKIRVKLSAFSDFKFNLCLDKGSAGALGEKSKKLSSHHCASLRYTNIAQNSGLRIGSKCR